MLQHGVEARHLGSAEGHLIGFMVLSFDVKNASEAVHVESVKSSFESESVQTSLSYNRVLRTQALYTSSWCELSVF